MIIRCAVCCTGKTQIQSKQLSALRIAVIGLALIALNLCSVVCCRLIETCILKTFIKVLNRIIKCLKIWNNGSRNDVFFRSVVSWEQIKCLDFQLLIKNGWNCGFNVQNWLRLSKMTEYVTIILTPNIYLVHRKRRF